LKRLVWLTMIVLGLTACGRSTTAAPTTIPSLAQVTGISLAGVAFDVHQEPG